MRTRFLLKLLPLSALALSAAASASAQSYWSAGHGDIGISLHEEPHGNHSHFHLESNWGLDSGSVLDGSPLNARTEFLPNQVIAWASRETTTILVASTALGVADGTSVYRAGNNTYQPNLGFAAYGIGSDQQWVGGGLTISLSGISVNNPGNFALLEGGSTIIMSTFDSALSDDNNSFFLGAGDHTHFAWYFSHAGYYELTFTWSGEHIDEGLISVTNTYGFQVGAAIPEPSTWAAILGGVVTVGTVAARRRNKRVA